MTGRTVYVVDDEQPIRGALKMLLGAQGFAVVPFASGGAFLDAVATLEPGCVLLDVRMPDVDGLEVQRRLGSASPGMPVVVMTGHGDLAVAMAALQNGAVGFVEKPFAKSTLRRAVDAAFLSIEDPGRYDEHVAAARSAVARLDDDYRAILERLATGRPNEAIAAELGVDTATVELRRARLFADLGIDNLSEALTVAFAAGLSQ